MKLQTLLCFLFSALVAGEGRKSSKKGSSKASSTRGSKKGRGSSSDINVGSTTAINGSFIDAAAAAGYYGTLLGLVISTDGVLDAVVANSPVSKLSEYIGGGKQLVSNCLLTFVLF